MLIAETSEEANTKLEWRTFQEDKGLPISRIKTEYLRYNFSEIDHERVPEVTIGQDVIACMTKFKYLGSVIQSNEEIKDDVTHQIQAGWLKWRATTMILCEKKFLTRLKGKFYRVAIRQAMLYEAEC